MWKYRWWILLLAAAWFAGSSWYYICKIQEHCMPSGGSSDAGTVILSNLNLQDSAWQLNINDNFRFLKNGFAPVTPVLVSNTLDSLSGYIKGAGATGKTITVTGYYRTDETNTGKYENLGKARAEVVKQMLVQRGLPEGNIFTIGKEQPALDISMLDSIYNSITMNIGTIGSGEMSEDILFQPRKIYFETGKNAMVVTDELKSYFQSAQKYLATHPNDQLGVVGHTDNKGDSLKNESLSKQRAVFVQGELSKMGLSAAQIVTDGKGQAQPIADNATEEGRKQNRRVEVTLIKKQ
jgi:OOP family OmpA-OmpF porin